MASKRTTSISAFRMSVASALKTRSTKEKLLRVAVEIAELDRLDKVNTAEISVDFNDSDQTASALQAFPGVAGGVPPDRGRRLLSKRKVENRQQHRQR